MIKKLLKINFLIIGLLIISNAHADACAKSKTCLSRNGQALFNIVIGENAHEVTRLAAQNLASYLEKITTAKFDVQVGKGDQGIVVGLASDFPKTSINTFWAKVGSFDRENYFIKSHDKGVYLIGATPLAVRHAVWDFLYQLGYRHYFPGNKWEIIPHTPALSVQIDVQESPDYVARRIWYNYGAWDYAAQPYADWNVRNRMASGFELNTGHAYGKIIRQEKQAFSQHPEYYALVDGKHQVKPNAKLSISNEGLRHLVVKYARNYFQKNPQADSISMDPSDGGGWCNSDKCSALGSVSDRALILANEVAAAVNTHHEAQERYVGMYAYNLHSPPPSIAVHPKVIISVATAFLKGGYTLDEIISGWQAKGATLGIREYYSVNTWDRDMPGRARGSNIEYLRRTIPEFYRQGARFLSAESGDNWGANGLGYYLASRMLWDVQEAKNIDQLKEYFLTQAFAKAKEPMRNFYQKIDGSSKHLLLDDQIAQMFRALADARKLAIDPAVKGRIDDLVLYAHYVDLYNRYSNAKGGARQVKFAELIKYAYRMRRTMMVHTKALYRDLERRDKAVSIPEGAGWQVAEGSNPWKSSTPFSSSELDVFVKQGVDAYQLAAMNFEPIRFSYDLVSAKAMNLTGKPLGNSKRGRGIQHFIPG